MSYTWTTIWAAAAGLACIYAATWLAGGTSGRLSTDFSSYLIDESVDRKKKRRPAAERGVVATDFNAFLKENSSSSRPAPAATDFNAFLLSTATADDQDIEGNDENKVSQDFGPPDDKAVVTVLFGTEYGFAQEIAGKLTEKIASDERLWPRLANMADHPEGIDLGQEQVLLVVCSTQGDGVAPSEARGFCDWLHGLEKDSLPHLSYAVCALGDTSYEHFCACGKQLDTDLRALGAAAMTARVDVNREDWKAVDGWQQAVTQELSRMSLQTAEETGYVLGDSKEQQAAGTTRSRPFLAEAVAIEGLCNISTADDKDTIRVELDLGDSGLQYEPGDALGIHASNAPEVVADLLAKMHADPAELHPLPVWHYADDARPAGSEISLEDMLLHCYDLRSPKTELLQLLLDVLPSGSGEAANRNGAGQKAFAHTNGHGPHHMANGCANGHESEQHSKAKQSGEQQARELRRLLSAPAEELEAYFEARHVADVLSDFSLAKPPLERLLRALRPLQPRLYSISSSQLENSRRVQVTVAVVRYTSLLKERLGVASTHLAERMQVGAKLPVYISKNPDFRLPADPSVPIIMVGPGTGLAPFRAFVQHRLAGSPRGPGPAVLYFGCRRRSQDFLYGGLLEAWAAAGHLDLYTAFSREQEQKVYVQDRLRETGARVWQLLEAGGHFYVCGDAAHMAAAVEEALLDVLSDHQDSNRAAAEAYLDRLKAQQRYQRDVWY